MRIGIDMDQAFIWYLPDQGGVEAEVPYEKVVEWRRVMRKFNECQKEMEKYWNENRNRGKQDY